MAGIEPAAVAANPSVPWQVVVVAAPAGLVVAGLVTGLDDLFAPVRA